MPDSFSKSLTQEQIASEAQKRKVLSQSGRLSSRARFERLFDAGSYTEIASFLGAQNSDDADRMLCAFGAVDGECVYAFSQEFAQNGAAFTANSAKKLLALYELAGKRPAPIVGFFDANGSDLAGGLSLMAGLGEICAASAAYRGAAPQIALIAGPCGASLAAFASGFDLILQSSVNGELFVNAPSVVKNETGVADHAKAQSAAKQGQVHAVYESEESMIDALKNLLSYLPEDDEAAAPIASCADDENRATAAFDRIPDAKALLCDVFDQGSLFALSDEFSDGILTGFARLSGVSVGYAACTGKELSRRDLMKLIRFTDLCDRFGIALMQFVNTPGFCAECESKHGLADLVSRLVSRYADADVPMLTLYHGKAYGAVLSVFASKSLGADLVFATPAASLSLLAPDSAVAFSENDRLKGSSDPIRGRTQLIERYLKEETSPVHAARAGLIDDILDPAEVRARLAFSIKMLLGI